MKIKEVQKKGDKLYTITFEKRTLFGTKTFVRDVVNYCGFFKFANNDKYVKLDDTLNILIQNLKGYEPLEIN
mgnify:FL=1